MLNATVKYIYVATFMMDVPLFYRLLEGTICAKPQHDMSRINLGWPRYDCNAGFENWQVGWSNAKMDFCCQTQQKGCPTQV